MRGEFRKSAWMLMVGALTAMVVGVWPGSASGAPAQGEAFLDKTVSFSTSDGGAVRPASDKVNTAVATFDSLPEGPSTTILTDGGITFFGLDNRLPGSPTPLRFTIEGVGDGSLVDQDGFTPPNVLGFGGYGPGSGLALSRVGEFRILPPQRAKSAQLELWQSGGPGGNVVTLEAIRRGSVVATDSVTLLGDVLVHHHTLSVSGRTFDELRVVGSGETDNGVFFAVIDSVRIG